MLTSGFSQAWKSAAAGEGLLLLDSKDTARNAPRPCSDPGDPPMTRLRAFPPCLFAALLAAPFAPALAQVSIVNPGAPGEPTRELSADEAVRIAASR